MSKGRVFSRPRTKVYDTNYNIGESYYRPALDRLDRKYGGGLPNGDSFAFRPPQPPLDPPSPRPTLPPLDDDFFPDRRRPHSALLSDLDAFFDPPLDRSPARAPRPLDDQLHEDLAASMTRLRARALDDDSAAFARKETRLRAKMDFGEKMMDSVGLGGRARQALEEEGSAAGRRRLLRMTSEGGEGEEMTRWTALKQGGAPRRGLFEEEQEAAAQTGAAARARRSRALLEDIESEMQAISEKSAAREKRVRDLKALVQENEASALDNLQATIKVKSSIQSEKKTVTF